MSTENTLPIIPLEKPKSKRVSRVKVVKVEQLSRNKIYLRPIKKAYLIEKRFNVSLDLLQVAYVLKSGVVITTNFVELQPIEINCLPEAQTYLKFEDKDSFTLNHTTALFSQRELDYVNIIDSESNIIFCQEYGGSYY